MIKLTISLRFVFCKRCLKYWNLQTWTKKSNAFYVGVLLLKFLLEIFSTLLTLHCLKCPFHVNIQIDKVINVMFVENISIWNVISENISKNNTWFFLGSMLEVSIFLTTFTQSKSFSNVHTFLNPWALAILVQKLRPTVWSCVSLD